MKVCLIVEGAYPYVNGGVSSWMQGLMLAMPDVEFVVQSIAASPDANLQFKYQIPSKLGCHYPVFFRKRGVVECAAFREGLF